MIYNVSELLDVKRPKHQYFLQKFLCFLLFSVMFTEPYLLKCSGDFPLILTEQISYYQLVRKSITSFDTGLVTNDLTLRII